MSDAQAKIGHALLKGLVSLREQKGGLSLEDIGNIFEKMSSNFMPSTSITDQFLHQEIAHLAQNINDAKKEIFAISTNLA